MNLNELLMERLNILEENHVFVRRQLISQK